MVTYMRTHMRIYSFWPLSLKEGRRGEIIDR